MVSRNATQLSAEQAALNVSRYLPSLTLKFRTCPGSIFESDWRFFHRLQSGRIAVWQNAVL